MQTVNSIAPQHTLNKLTQWSPIVFSLRQIVLVDKQDIVLETGIEMWLEAELHDHWIVMAVDVSVDTIESLEHLTNGCGKSFWERHTCNWF